MAVNVYLYFNGNCREAIEFYAQVFQTEKPRIMTFGDAPQTPGVDLPENAKNLILHAELKISGSNIMFSDVFPGTPFNVGSNISLTVVSNNEDDVRTWFNRMKEGGKVGMELQKTFWSKSYGTLTDKFGVPWQFSCMDRQ